MKSCLEKETYSVTSALSTSNLIPARERRATFSVVSRAVNKPVYLKTIRVCRNRSGYHLPFPYFSLEQFRGPRQAEAIGKQASAIFVKTSLQTN